LSIDNPQNNARCKNEFLAVVALKISLLRFDAVQFVQNRVCYLIMLLSFLDLEDGADMFLRNVD
jgi:hypothetical protein